MTKFAFKVISITESGSHAFCEAFISAGSVNVPLGKTGLLPIDKTQARPALQSMLSVELPQGWGFDVVSRDIQDADGTVVATRPFFTAVQK